MAAVANSGSGAPNVPIALWNNASSAITDDVIEDAIQSDPDLAEIASRLDNEVVIDADRELNLDVDSSDTASDNPGKDSDSISTSSSLRDVADDHTGSANGSPDGSRKTTEPNKIDNEQTDSTAKASTSSSSSSSQHTNGSAKASSHSERKLSLPLARRGSKDSSVSKTSLGSSKEKNGTDDKHGKKNPLQLLRRLTKFDKSSKKSSMSPPDYTSEFSAVVIDKLPQVFVVKYLGHRPVQGVCGLHHVRKPVDEMVKAVKEKLDNKAEVELPLLYVVVSPKGLDLREHKRNKVPDIAPLGLMPIDFISYGVQDIKFWRVFTCIVVRELSSRSRSATCHAFLCDSAHNGRKMALALGASFNVYAKKLTTAGKTHNFQVELRPPDELADAVNAEFEA